ncbi:MAG TPA: hypothetical protein VNA66_04540 [Gammaproteobacteria bacterium]|nr:hypothetical protein [Gammaproteobacteria bacterium]
MLKLTVFVLAISLAGTASAAGWRKLQIDASSEAAFDESVTTFQQKLSPARRFVLGQALRDIWSEGVQAAKAEQREYTTADYYEQIDGLSYQQLVTLTDPTGDTAKDRYRAATTGAARYANRSSSPSPWANTPSPPPVQNGVYRGWTTNGGIRVDTNGCGC